MTKIRMTITVTVEYPLKREYYDGCKDDAECIAVDVENAIAQPMEFITMGDFSNEVDVQITAAGEIVE